MRQSRNGATVELSFIYLKRITAGDKHLVKVPMPKTFDLLMKTAARYYGSEMNVKALYTEEGRKIENMFDVAPGTVLLVADRDINLDLHKTGTPTKRRSKKQSVGSEMGLEQLFGDRRQRQTKCEVIQAPEKQVKQSQATPRSKSRRSTVIDDTDTDDEAFERAPQQTFQIGDVASIPGSARSENGRQLNGATPQSGFNGRGETQGFKGNTPQFKNDRTPQGVFQFKDGSTPTSGYQGNGETPTSGFRFNDGTTPGSGVQPRDGKTPQRVFHFKSGRVSGPGVQSKGETTPRDRGVGGERTPRSGLQSATEKTPQQGGKSQKTPQGLMRPRTPKSAFQTKFERSVNNAMSASPDENIDMNETPKSRKNSPKRLRDSPLTPKEEVEMEKQSTLEMGDAFSKLVGEANVDASKMWEAVKALRKARRESLPMFANVGDFELMGLCDWMYHGLKAFEALNFPRVSDEYFAYNTLVAKARSVITSHRKAMPGGTCYHFRVGIVGPPRSGKSSFLSLLGEEIMSDLLATGAFKRTFIMAMDCSQLSTVVNNDKLFYQAIVQTTIHCLRWQAPHLRGKIDILQKFFESVTDVTTYPRFPGSYANSGEERAQKGRYQKLAKDLCDLWHDDRRRASWYLAVAMFPTFLAQAVGFKDVIFLIDHFDELDVDAPTTGHFAKSPDRVSLADAMKLVLQQNSFVISCRNEHQFYNILAPSEIVPGVFCDGTAGIDFITSDVGEDCPCQDDKHVFSMEIAGHDEQLEVSRDDLGNYPAYVRHWKELVEASRKARKCKDYLDDDNLLFIDAGQALVGDVYVSSDWKESMIVDSVHEINRR